MATASGSRIVSLYEICIASFADGDGDGLGDLPGLVSRLDHLDWLGVDAIWVTPFYATGFFDLGYDVIDHRAVDPRFGSLAHFDQLLERAHSLGIRVVLDFVPNHTSDRHPWFRESRCSRTNPYRDWYVWRDARSGGGPPSNWCTQYLTSAWTFDSVTNQYYLHSFHQSQPDLNWTNPEVREAMAAVLRFWLDRGVDGCRIDAMVHLIKDSLLRDNPAAPGRSIDDWPAWPMTPAYTQDHAALQEVVSELCGVIHEYPDKVIVGENHLPVERLSHYYDAGVTHPVNAQLLDTEWTAADVRRAVDRYEGVLADDACPNWVVGSHDNPRVATRWGESRTRAVAMLQFTLRGTPIVYYGDELGLENVPVSHGEAMDPLARLLPGQGLGRDAQRSPMPWDSSPNAGFSEIAPWLPIGSRNADRNVARQREDESSLLNLYRKLLHLRRDSRAIREGTYRPAAESAEIFAFLRESNEERLLTAINFTDRLAKLDHPVQGQVILSTNGDRQDASIDGALSLCPNEGIIVSVTN